MELVTRQEIIEKVNQALKEKDPETKKKLSDGNFVYWQLKTGIAKKDQKIDGGNVIYLYSPDAVKLFFDCIGG